MNRLAVIALLVGCTDPPPEEPKARISVDIMRVASGETTVSGCWIDGWFCSNGTDSMLVRSGGREIVAPYEQQIAGGHYVARTDQIAGGAVVEVELDGDIGRIEIPIDNDFIVPATPIHASTQTTVQWMPSSNATSAKLAAYWLCNDSQGGSYAPAPIVSFPTDPGVATVDVLGSRPEHLHDRICEVSVGVIAETRAQGERLDLVARQFRKLDLILDEPGPLP